jgi:antitoxin MazE
MNPSSDPCRASTVGGAKHLPRLGDLPFSWQALCSQWLINRSAPEEFSHFRHASDGLAQMAVSEGELQTEVHMYIHCISARKEGDMIVEFCRWGNSLAVRIPKALAEALKVSDGKQAEINVENGTLVLRPIVKPGRKPRYTLDELLRGMTKDNVPQEIDWGPARGKEAW